VGTSCLLISCGGNELPADVVQVGESISVADGDLLVDRAACQRHSRGYLCTVELERGPGGSFTVEHSDQVLQTESGEVEAESVFWYGGDVAPNPLESEDVTTIPSDAEGLLQINFSFGPEEGSGETFKLLLDDENIRVPLGSD
jgi:hypothetical protein